MSDPLFTERARSYGLKWKDQAHKRAGVSKTRWNSYIRDTNPALPRDKKFRSKIKRNGLTAQRTQIYRGAYEHKRERLVEQRDMATSTVGKQAYQQDIDDLDNEFRSGRWETAFKAMNRLVTSKSTSIWDDLDDEYENIILGAGSSVSP